MTTRLDPPLVVPPGRVWPDRAAVHHLAAILDTAPPGEPLVPLVTWLPADLDTPVSAYLKLTGGDTDTGFGFLLESIHGGDHPGRWSFMGVNPTAQLRVAPGAGDPLAELAAHVARRRVIVAPDAPWPPFIGGAVGYVGYEAVGAFEPVPAAVHDPHGLPLALFGLYDTVVAFDHAFAQMQVITFVSLAADVEVAYTTAQARLAAVCARLTGPLPGRQSALRGQGSAGNDVASAGRRTQNSELRIQNSNCTPAEYEALVLQAKEHIAAGDVIQVVLSQRFTRPTPAAPFAVYRALRALNPSPYLFYLQLGDFQLIGASPEMLVQVRDGVLATHPIAGTRPRGEGATQDAALAEGLLADPKERAEHLMLVDLARNDIGRVASIGSVAVPRLFEIEHYSHVMHIVSRVTGRLRPGLLPVDALRSCFPAGTLSGAPKVRAMQIIAALERDQRGPYGGAVGYLSASGNLDMAITIRTIMLRDGVATVQAGAGIVADSVPAAEAAECANKAHALFVALDRAEGGAA